MSSPAITNIDIVDLTALAEVHLPILNHLKRLIPAKLLRINKTYYHELLPVVYGNLKLDENNVRGVLEGWQNPFKRAALQQVKNLHIVDLETINVLFATFVNGYADDNEGSETQFLSASVRPVFTLENLHIDSQVFSQYCNAIAPWLNDEENADCSLEDNAILKASTPNHYIPRSIYH